MTSSSCVGEVETGINGGAHVADSGSDHDATLPTGWLVKDLIVVSYILMLLNRTSSLSWSSTEYIKISQEACWDENVKGRLLSTLVLSRYACDWSCKIVILNNFMFGY